MGLFFARRGTSSQLPALSKKRLIALFEQAQWEYYNNSSGKLLILTDGIQFSFSFLGELGEILVIIAHNQHVYSIEDLSEIRTFINSWSSDYLWPKAFHDITHDGHVMLVASCGTDFEEGATDEQLMAVIKSSMAACLHFFSGVDSKFVPQIGV